MLLFVVVAAIAVVAVVGVGVGAAAAAAAVAALLNQKRTDFRLKVTVPMTFCQIKSRTL